MSSNTWICSFQSSRLPVIKSSSFNSGSRIKILLLGFLSHLHRCPSQSVVVCSRAEDSADHTTHSGVSLDLLGRLLAFALEAGLMTFQAGSASSHGLAVSTVV